jgi:hypothetical protein
MEFMAALYRTRHREIHRKNIAPQAVSARNSKDALDLEIALPLARARKQQNLEAIQPASFRKLQFIDTAAEQVYQSGRLH